MAVTNIGRVVAGAHWPTDVMAGDLLGLALVSGTVVAARAGAAAAEERWGGGTDTLKHKP